MEDGGSYNQHAECQARVVEDTKENLLSAIMRINVSKGKPIDRTMDKPFIIADLGCSQGRNSRVLLSFLLNNLQLTDDDEYMIFFNDQSSNDWKSLVGEIAMSPITTRPSFFVAESFYKRLFPSSFVDFAVSYIALHWLSRVPASIPQGMFISTIKDSHPGIYSEWSTQAHLDLQNFFLHRAFEMKDNGELCFTLVCEGKNHVPFEIIAACLDRLRAEGVISSSEFDAINFPLYYRSVEEVLKAIPKEFTLNETKIVNENYFFETGNDYGNFFLSVLMPSILSCLHSTNELDGSQKRIISGQIHDIDMSSRPDFIRASILKELSEFYEEPCQNKRKYQASTSEGIKPKTGENVVIPYLFVSVTRKPRIAISSEA